MARPTKLNDEVTAKICEALRTGNTRRAACAYAGIDQDTLGNWLRRSSDFSDAVKKAESDCEISYAAVIKRAAVGHDVYKKVTKTKTVGEVSVVETTETISREFEWQAAAWWLERRKPEDYARFVFDPSKLTPEQMADIIGPESGAGAEARSNVVVEYAEDNTTTAASRSTEGD